MNAHRWLACALVSAALTLTGCQSDSDPAGTASSTTAGRNDIADRARLVDRLPAETVAYFRLPTPWGLVGLTVCYDLRFAYLYRMLAQAGATFLTVPAAFTHTTGKAHWHVLLRSRAIETGCFVLAACQWGRHGDARTYGHSLVVDPWGAVLAEGGEEEECVVLADIDAAKVEEARAMIPALRHDRPVAPAKPPSLTRARA